MLSTGGVSQNTVDIKDDDSSGVARLIAPTPITLFDFPRHA